jgi:membrane-associated phospholipid phosphatase
MNSNLLMKSASIGLLLCAHISHADTLATWKTTSDVLAVGLPAAAGAITLMNQDKEGMQQLALSLGSTLAATEVLKSVIHERRPDGSDNKSFPSGHTAIAFSAATFLAQREGDRLGAWTPAVYSAAVLTGVARVQADKHHWGDVMAGAALGYGISRYWTQPRNQGQITAIPTANGLAVAWYRQF